MHVAADDSKLLRTERNPKPHLHCGSGSRINTVAFSCEAAQMMITFGYPQSRYPKYKEVHVMNEHIHIFTSVTLMYGSTLCEVRMFRTNDVPFSHQLLSKVSFLVARCPRDDKLFHYRAWKTPKNSIRPRSVWASEPRGGGMSDRFEIWLWTGEKERAEEGKEWSSKGPLPFNTHGM